MSLKNIVELYRAGGTSSFTRNRDTSNALAICKTESCVRFAAESTPWTQKDFWVCSDCEREVFCSTCIIKSHSGHSTVSYVDHLIPRCQALSTRHSDLASKLGDLDPFRRRKEDAFETMRTVDNSVSRIIRLLGRQWPAFRDRQFAMCGRLASGASRIETEVKKAGDDVVLLNGNIENGRIRDDCALSPKEVDAAEKRLTELTAQLPAEFVQLESTMKRIEEGIMSMLEFRQCMAPIADILKRPAFRGQVSDLEVALMGNENDSEDDHEDHDQCRSQQEEGDDENENEPPDPGHDVAMDVDPLFEDVDNMRLRLVPDDQLWNHRAFLGDRPPFDTYSRYLARTGEGGSTANARSRQRGDDTGEERSARATPWDRSTRDGPIDWDVDVYPWLSVMNAFDAEPYGFAVTRNDVSVRDATYPSLQPRRRRAGGSSGHASSRQVAGNTNPQGAAGAANEGRRRTAQLRGEVSNLEAALSRHGVTSGAQQHDDAVASATRGIGHERSHDSQAVHIEFDIPDRSIGSDIEHSLVSPPLSGAPAGGPGESGQSESSPAPAAVGNSGPGQARSRWTFTRDQSGTPRTSTGSEDGSWETGDAEDDVESLAESAAQPPPGPIARWVQQRSDMSAAAGNSQPFGLRLPSVLGAPRSGPVLQPRGISPWYSVLLNGGASVPPVPAGAVSRSDAARPGTAPRRAGQTNANTHRRVGGIGRGRGLRSTTGQQG